jgi:hypothetical protein
LLQRPAPTANITNASVAVVSSERLQALRSHREAGLYQQLARSVQWSPLANAGAEFLGPVGVGTVSEPKACDVLNEQACQRKAQQTLRVIFDTGSSNIWMASNLCDQGPCVSKDRKRYNLLESETSEVPLPHVKHTIEFGTAMIEGPFGVDDFHIGPFIVKNQTFGLIERQQGAMFEAMPIEGVIGLGFPSLSASHNLPFFDNIIAQRVLPRNQFAFYLADTPSQATGHPMELGAVLWGGYDSRLFNGPLSWVQVTQAHYWSIDLYDFLIGNKSLLNKDAPMHRHQHGAILGQDLGVAPAKLILDSGTSHYTAFGSLYNALVDTMPYGSCEELATYPTLTYRLKDVDGHPFDVVLEPADYVISDGTTCEVGYQQLDVPEQYGPGLVLGELFMRKFFTVFDRGDGTDTDARVGFARAKPWGEVSHLLELQEPGSSLLDSGRQVGLTGSSGSWEAIASISNDGDMKIEPASVLRPEFQHHNPITLHEQVRSQVIASHGLAFF